MRLEGTVGGLDHSIYLKGHSFCGSEDPNSMLMELEKASQNMGVGLWRVYLGCYRWFFIFFLVKFLATHRPRLTWSIVQERLYSMVCLKTQGCVPLLRVLVGLLPNVLFGQIFTFLLPSLLPPTS